MKPMEYTIKVVTDGPVDASAILNALEEIDRVISSEITSYRVKPVPRPPKTQP